MLTGLVLAEYSAWPSAPLLSQLATNLRLMGSIPAVFNDFQIRNGSPNAPLDRVVAKTSIPWSYKPFKAMAAFLKKCSSSMATTSTPWVSTSSRELKT